MDDGVVLEVNGLIQLYYQAFFCNTDIMYLATMDYSHFPTSNYSIHIF